jgi:hypothetical protein
MAKSGCFFDAGKGTTNLAQPIEDLRFTQHLGKDAAYDRIIRSEGQRRMH